MRSLQAKIVFVYLALAFLIVGLSTVALVELDRIADKAREGGKVAELFDATLEMRRFEKNHFLYNQAHDLAEHARFSARARELLKRDAGTLDALAGPGTVAALAGDLERYEAAMSAHARAPFDETLANRARGLGNRIVTAGERLSALERQSMNAALAAHQRNLLVSLAVVAALLILTGILTARRVARPLQTMEARMRAVASGRLTRLALDSPERELVSLADAFNRVLDELERRQHTLVRAEKLASLGTLLSGVAHELNNPLSNISSSAQILKEDLASPASGGGVGGEGRDAFHRQLVEDIDTETLRARRIVRALLDYAGDREFRPAPVPLAELVEETLRFLKSKRPPGVDIRTDIAPDLTVRGDRPRLQQVLLNLIVNAYDAMGEAGLLTISARAVIVGAPDDGFAAHLGQCRPGAAVVDLSLVDSGPGIPADLLPRVFDPFFTTKPVGQGSGLGLFITHEIIEEHGGCIGVSNRRPHPPARRRESNAMTARLLLVDDERIALRNLEHVLAKEGYQVTATQSGGHALDLLDTQPFDLVLTDMRMDKVDGMQLLRRCKARFPDVEVIMITGFATLESAVEAMKEGAFHYIAKPFRLDEVRQTVAEALEKIRLKRENRALREQLDAYQGRVRIITRDGGMQKLLDMARQVAPTGCNVLITGESGTGKELFARTLHEFSGRPDGPFLAINCGAFNEELLANELFGHEKGAFTGAVGKTGLLLAAHGGTLFLDEVTEMTPAMQVKLLRVIQEKEVLPVGGTKPVKVDVRFIAASNRNMKDWVADGRFRQDLYYRLNVVNLHIPPLSERREDIPLLAQHFLDRAAPVMGKPVRILSEEALALLKAYDFPGNVRELENIIERGVALCQGDTLEAAHLPDDLRDLSIRAFRRRDGRILPLEDQERDYILWVLEEAHGNQTLAAQMLGIDRVSLWRKLKRYEGSKD
jgi:DNA-binding NtrC family response regulator/signal transduction histidine kinase